MKHNNYVHLFEDEKEKTSATPGEVLSAIMGLPDTLETKKKEFLIKLQGFAKDWKEKKTELVTAKKDLFDAATKNGATKTVLRAAGATPADKPEADGKTYKPKTGDLPKAADIAQAIKDDEWDGDELAQTTGPEGSKTKKKLSDIIKEIKDAEDSKGKEKTQTPAEKIQELKDKGFDKIDVSDPAETKSVDIKDANGDSTPTEKPKYKESKKTKELYEKLIDLEKKLEQKSLKK
jgi:hypothetical protein